jgi:hypothetical protein
MSSWHMLAARQVYFLNNKQYFFHLPIHPFFLHFFNIPLLLIIFNKDIITLRASQEAKFYVALGIARAGNK